MSSITSSTSTALVPFDPEQNALYRAHVWLQKNQASSITIPLSGELKQLFRNVLIPFQRHIEKLYVDLPWPKQMQKVLVVTTVTGGKGDIAAGAKAISLMQRICPKSVTFDWMAGSCGIEPLAFLSDVSRVQARRFGEGPTEKGPVDFILDGPITTGASSYIKRYAQREIQGPIYGFKEIAVEGIDHDPRMVNLNYFKNIFPDDDQLGYYRPMGIIPGSGVFLDEERINAPRSREYCCPTYLLQIQDDSLRKDILTSMRIYDDQTVPDYDKYSFNSGYAQKPNMWKVFIEAVSIHEREKNVVIVLNQEGEFQCLSAKDFFDHMFTSEYLDFLQTKGYGSVTLKSLEGEIAILLENGTDKRGLTVIIRPRFKPQDMRNLQLASERLLTTGDNTAIESWCARCILYLYECLPHKGKFKQQQIDLAKKIAPSVASLLELHQASLTDLEEVLSHPDLAKDTLHFCKYITQHCSFAPIFEAAVKRTAWHYLKPELLKVEEETIGKEFHQDVIAYVEDPQSRKSLTLGSLGPLKERIHKIIEE